MTPDFALSLSFDGITLLRRVPGGWTVVDEVALDSDDLKAALRGLRRKADALSPRGGQVKLVIPNEQIRYLSIPAPDSGALRDAIEAALDGATPYAVSDLVYDWSEQGDTVHIAAVARETLDEAQSFTDSHHFDPVAFVAIAPKGSFDGEVFFGAAPGWTGPAPARDDRAITLVAAPAKAAVAPKPEAVAPAPKAQTPTPAPEAAPAPQPDMAAAARSAMPPAETEPGTPVSTAAEQAAAPAEQAAPPAKAAAKQPDAARTAPAAAAPPKAAQRDAGDDGLSPGKADADKPATPPLASTPPPAALKVPQPDRSAAVSAPSIAPHTDAEKPVPGFVSIRASRSADGAAPSLAAPARGTAPAPRGTPPAMVGARITPTLSSSDSAAPVASAAVTPSPATSAPPLPPSAGKPTPVPAPTLTAPSAKALASLDRPADPAPVPPTAPRRGKGGGFFSRRKPAPVDPLPPSPAPVPAQAKQAPRPPQPRPSPSPVSTSAMARLNALRSRSDKPVLAGAAAAPAEDTERERMTVFGARRDQAIGGKPRFLGLMLTAALLLMLVGVAAWASVFLDEGLVRFFRPDTSPAVAVADADETDADIADAAEATIELVALDPDLPPAPGSDTPEALPGGLSEPASERPRALSEDEAAATYAATGIWQRAPSAPEEPSQGAVDDVYIASIDPEVQQFDAVALPEASLARDPGFVSPPVPAPASVVFDLDARGLVRAVPEGAMNADGILIYAGLPPVVPPLRSADGAQPPADTPESRAEDTRLQGLRPQARPADIVERNERATLAGNSVAELARLRPAARPDVAKLEEEADVTATALAVSTSRTPLPRPRDIARIVEAARARPAPQPEAAPEVQVASAGAVAPRTVAPSIPSSTSVAQAATVRGAINLRQVNLIGVYGKESSRRALVRLSNGRYQKVQIGDRVEGGRVAAIGDSELHYTKGGRTVVLRMP